MKPPCTTSELERKGLEILERLEAIVIGNDCIGFPDAFYECFRALPSTLRKER